MGLMGRGVVFTTLTIANAVLFVVSSRGVLTIIDMANTRVGSGPATPAFDLLPVALQLAMGIVQLGLIVYLITGIGEERTARTRRSPP